MPRDLIRGLGARTSGDVLQAIPSLAQRQNDQGYEAFNSRGLFVDTGNGCQLDGLRVRNILAFDPRRCSGASRS